MRDGVSLNQQRKDRDVIMPAEVMGLPNLQGFIKLVGDLPGGRFAIKRGTIPTIAEPFVKPVRDPMQDVADMPEKDIIILGDDGDDGMGVSAPAEPLPVLAETPKDDGEPPAESADGEAPKDTAEDPPTGEASREEPGLLGPYRR
jgi:hypothetical protein